MTFSDVFGRRIMYVHKTNPNWKLKVLHILIEWIEYKSDKKGSVTYSHLLLLLLEL